MALRTEFPEAGSDYLGGNSDGWEYRTVFSGSRLEDTYAMVRQFLQEEGYGDVPVPATTAELRLFRFRTARGKPMQMRMFEEHGYIHNPIKILFPLPGSMRRNTLILCIYNDGEVDHLLRFHGLKSP